MPNISDDQSSPVVKNNKLKQTAAQEQQQEQESKNVFVLASYLRLDIRGRVPPIFFRVEGGEGRLPPHNIIVIVVTSGLTGHKISYMRARVLLLIERTVVGLFETLVIRSKDKMSKLLHCFILSS